MRNVESENPDAPTARTGAEIVAATLASFGTQHVFQIPGEGILEIADAVAQLQPGIRLITCRHEGGMLFAAQATGRLTGLPGVALAARAPGALNAALGLHTADTDAAPTVLVVGQVPTDQAGRDPLSGDDLAQVFRPMVKEVVVLTDAKRIPEQLERAWHSALSGRMGPVVVIAPEDVMHQQANVVDAVLPVPAQPAPAPALMAQLRRLVSGARRPMIIAGGSGWCAEDCRLLSRWVERHAWPVVTSYRRSDLFDNDNSHYVGELGIGIDGSLATGVGQADLIVAIDVRLGEINTFGSAGFGGFKLVDIMRQAGNWVQVHSDARELKRAYRPGLAINASPGEFLRALEAQSLPRAPVDMEWTAGLAQARRAFVNSGSCEAPVNLREAMTELRRQVPDDAIITVGAGAYATWLHRYFAFRRPGTLLGPKSGAMGYGLPAAIGAALCRPGRVVVALAGDGCFLMHGEELATAVQHGLQIIVLVVNNNGYGAIRATQQKLFGRETGTALHNPDFAAYARAFGAHSERVLETIEFAPALARCLAHAGPSLIELVLPAHIGKPL